MKLPFCKCKGPEAGGQDLFKEVNMAEEVRSGCSGHGHAPPMGSEENNLLLVAPSPRGLQSMGSLRVRHD